MKVILTTLNAKYIHTSLALRLLYVANKESFDIDFIEYTIKEDLNKIADELIATSCSVLGLGVYIWNAVQTENLIKILKQKKQDLIIILGGPEVSYESDVFIQNPDVDYVVRGEGETVLGELLTALKHNLPVNIPGICSKEYTSKHVSQVDLVKLAEFDSPYSLKRDEDTMKNRLIYFETSRGCPYRCSYCLSSLEKGVRYYSQAYIETNLAYLIHSGAKQIKFLDRTFNLNKKHTKAVFDFLLNNYRPNLSCQFEIYADLLTDEIIDHLNNNLPIDYFRFEIGIQSTYSPSLEAVDRKQDFSLIARNIQRITKGGKITMHLDLIAGLPYESFDRFVQSFNEVFELRAKELQLGFLKLLRGTKLKKQAEQHGYLYQSTAPFELLSNNYISQEEIFVIHEMEDMLDKFWNSGRFRLTMGEVFSQSTNYFDFFLHLSKYFKANHYKKHGFSLEDLYQCMHGFLLTQGINLIEKLFQDYYLNFKIRPTISWIKTIEKAERKKLLYTIGQNKQYMEQHGLNRRMVEKQTALELLNHRYILTVFKENTPPFAIEYP